MTNMTDEIAGEDLLDLHTVVRRNDNDQVVRLRREAAINVGLTASKAKIGENVRVVWGGPTLGVPTCTGPDGQPRVQPYSAKEQLYRTDSERVCLQVSTSTRDAIQEMAGVLRLSASEFLDVIARLPANSYKNLIRTIRNHVEEDFPTIMMERQGAAGRDLIQTEHNGQQVAARDSGPEQLSTLRHSLYATYGLTPKTESGKGH